MTPLITLAFSNPKILGFDILRVGNIQPLEYSIFNNINLTSIVLEYNMSYASMNQKMKDSYAENIAAFLSEQTDVVRTINEFKIKLIKVYLNDLVVYFKTYQDYSSVILAV